MRKGLGVFFILAAVVMAIAIGAYAYHVDFWIAPPQQKFERSWSADIANLQKKAELPKEWTDIGEISVRTDASPAQSWLNNLKVPAQKTQTGHYRLEVFIIHWIDGNRYGAVVQHNLVDRATNNTIWEMNRTYKLGLVY